MSNIAKSRGSLSLTGAAAMRYRMPAMVGLSSLGNSSMVEQQLVMLWVTGSTPVFRSNCNHPATGLFSR